MFQANIVRRIRQQEFSSTVINPHCLYSSTARPAVQCYSVTLASSWDPIRAVATPQRTPTQTAALAAKYSVLRASGEYKLQDKSPQSTPVSLTAPRGVATGRCVSPPTLVAVLLNSTERLASSKPVLSGRRLQAMESLEESKEHERLML